MCDFCRHFVGEAGVLQRCSVLLYVAAHINRAMCDFCRHSLREVVELQCVVVRCGMLQTFGRHVTHSCI